MMRILLAAMLLTLSTNHTSAQSLEALEFNSMFVQKHIQYLKKKKAVSAYASTKPYCPTVYAWATGVGNKDARSIFKNETERGMRAAGFSASPINHCIQNSGFLFKSLTLQNHPKNSNYPRLVVPGVMVFRKVRDNAVSVIPVLVETHTYTDRVFRIYDQNFKAICTQYFDNWNMNGKCSRFGKVQGRASKNGDRYTFTIKSQSHNAMVFTSRTQQYALSKFR